MLRVVEQAFRKKIDALYKTTRQAGVGVDPRMSTLVLVEVLARRSVRRLRGVRRGYPTAFIGSKLRIRSRSGLTLGRSISIGDGVSIDALAARGIAIGDNSTIDDFAVLRGSGVIRNLGEGITIGQRSAIGAFNILLGQGGLDIGDDCLLGPNVTVVSENHIFQDPTVPIRNQGESRLPTRIGNDVWIGAGAVILGGSVIGDGAVVAAGAVVRGHVDSLSIVGGIPAKVLGHRGSHQA